MSVSQTNIILLYLAPLALVLRACQVFAGVCNLRFHSSLSFIIIILLSVYLSTSARLSILSLSLFALCAIFQGFTGKSGARISFISRQCVENWRTNNILDCMGLFFNRFPFLTKSTPPYNSITVSFLVYHYYPHKCISRTLFLSHYIETRHLICDGHR